MCEPNRQGPIGSQRHAEHHPAAKGERSLQEDPGKTEPGGGVGVSSAANASWPSDCVCISREL